MKMKLYLRQIALFLMIILASAGLSVAQVSAAKLSFTWTPPTHYAMEGVCTDQTVPLTAAEIAQIVYVVSYRNVTDTEWTVDQADSPLYVINDVPFGAEYQFHVQPKFPGGIASCPSNTVSATAPAQPSPGSCTNVQGTPGY